MRGEFRRESWELGKVGEAGVAGELSSGEGGRSRYVSRCFLVLRLNFDLGKKVSDARLVEIYSGQPAWIIIYYY